MCVPFLFKRRSYSESLEQPLAVKYPVWFLENITGCVSPFPGLPHTGVITLEISFPFLGLTSCVLEHVGVRS